MHHRNTASFQDMGPDFDELFEDVDALTSLEASSLHAIFGPYQVRDVLDCAAGTGIQALGLAALGYRVAASDISSAMIEELERKASRQQLSIQTLTADFRNLSRWKDRQFDAVINCGNSLTLLATKEAVTQSLRSMQAVIRPGGICVVGMHNYDKLRREDQGFYWRYLHPASRPPQFAFDIRRFGRERVEITYFLGSFKYGRWYLRSYTKSSFIWSGFRLRAEMSQAGFRNVRLWDVTGTREFCEDDEWVLAVGETGEATGGKHDDSR